MIEVQSARYVRILSERTVCARVRVASWERSRGGEESVGDWGWAIYDASIPSPVVSFGYRDFDP